MATLERRALLAVAPVVPSFNGGQAIVPPINVGGYTQNAIAATAVQSDGKVVVVGTATPVDSNPVRSGTAFVTLRRYNPDGSLDTTFGTAGQETFLPNAGNLTSFNRATVAPDIVIGAEDSITLAANLIDSSQANPVIPQAVGRGTAVVRFTRDGQVDATFGTDGEVDFLAGYPTLTRLALQTDGKILLGGTTAANEAAANPLPLILVTRLTTNGSVDPTFNGGNFTFLGEVATGVRLAPIATLTAIGQTSTGQVDLVYNAYPAATGVEGTSDTLIAGLNPDGSVHTSFGTNGFVRGASNTAILDAATVLPTGEVVMAVRDGTINDTLIRVAVDGTPEPFRVQPTLPFRADALLTTRDGSIVADGGILVGSKTQLAVARYNGDGIPNVAFGPAGVVRINVPDLPASTTQGGTRRLVGAGLALTLGGSVVVAGTRSYVLPPANFFSFETTTAAQGVVAILNKTNPTLGASNDYDGDGKSDIAAELNDLGVFAYRVSSGTGDVVQPFGASEAGQTLPAPGDYDGDGIDDVAAYIPSLNAFASRPAAGGGAADVVVPFGDGPGIVSAAALAIPTVSTVSAQSLPADPPTAEVLVYLPDDLPGKPPRKASA